MMDRSKDIACFEAKLAAMAERLSSLHVSVAKKEYHAEAFGSWHLIVGDDNRKIDFTYDGKDSYLRYHDAAVTPKDWRDFEHRRFKTWEGEDPLAFVEETLVRQFQKTKQLGEPTDAAAASVVSQKWLDI